MAQVQLFKKQTDGIENWKQNFLDGLEKSQSIFFGNVCLIPQKIFDFLENWIKSQNSFVARKDVSNFSQNIKNISEDENLKENIFIEIKKKKFPNGILQESFEYISTIDDFVSSREYIKQKQEKEKQKKLEIENMKQKEKTQKQEELENLEKMLENM